MTTGRHFNSLVTTPAAPAAKRVRKPRGSSKTITCQKCGERREPAMLHAIFCLECKEAMEADDLAKPVDADLGDRLFAEMSARRVKQGWRP